MTVEEPEEITLKFRGGEIVYAASNRDQELRAAGRVERCRGGGTCPNDSTKFCYYWFDGVEKCRRLT